MRRERARELSARGDDAASARARETRTSPPSAVRNQMLVAIVAAARDGQACARFCDGVFRFCDGQASAPRAARSHDARIHARACVHAARRPTSVWPPLKFYPPPLFCLQCNKALGDYRNSVVSWRNQPRLAEPTALSSITRAQQPPQALLARCAALPCVCVCVCRVQVSR